MFLVKRTGRPKVDPNRDELKGDPGFVAASPQHSSRT
jgi:hypothetical protein